jgi:hypothetical protein
MPGCIEDCDIHVHEPELHLHAASAPHELADIGEALECVKQVVQGIVIGPRAVLRDLALDRLALMVHDLDPRTPSPRA